MTGQMVRLPEDEDTPEKVRPFLYDSGRMTTGLSAVPRKRKGAAWGVDCLERSIAVWRSIA